MNSNFTLATIAETILNRVFGSPLNDDLEPYASDSRDVSRNVPTLRDMQVTEMSFHSRMTSDCLEYRCTAAVGWWTR